MGKYTIKNLLMQPKIVFRRKAKSGRIDYSDYPGRNLVCFFRTFRLIMTDFSLVIFVDDPSGVFLGDFTFNMTLRRGKQIL